jgi:hypothetical protein
MILKLLAPFLLTPFCILAFGVLLFFAMQKIGDIK